MNIQTLYFIYPGTLDTLTGGYQYDRRLILELRRNGIAVETIGLSEQFPYPDDHARQEAHQALAALPDGAVAIVDGLAFGALDDLAVAEQHRLRLIALCHHPLALESGLDEAQRQRFHRSEQRALNAARAVLVTSPTTRQTLIEQFGLPAERVTVALPGTDPTPFAPCEGTPPQLLTVATLTRRKGHDILIDALAQLVDLPWQARFVGGGAFDPDWSELLRQQVNRQQLQQRIAFVGALSELEPEFCNADLFVLPSRYEGYGMVFAEALAAGLPVVAARAGAVPDVVPDTAGVLVPPDDVNALAETLRELLVNESRRRQLQAGARRAAKFLPTWADTGDLVARLIEDTRPS